MGVDVTHLQTKVFRRLLIVALSGLVVAMSVAWLYGRIGWIYPVNAIGMLVFAIWRMRPPRENDDG